MQMETKTLNSELGKDSQSLGVASRPFRQQNEAFLSVIVLTRGHRLEELNDLFLCLSAQECARFELIVLVQNTDEDVRHEIDDLCVHVEAVARINVRSVDVGESNHLTALNEVITQLEGSHFTVIDEGDLLFDNWVSSFLTLAGQTSDKVLFVYPLRQEWQVGLENGSERLLRARGHLSNCYCHGFDFQEQTVYNDCPSVSLAFPTRRVQDLKLKYDEALTAISGWDFLMRAVAQWGINVCDTPSSIQRAWKNDVSVPNKFDRDTWDREYQVFREKFSSLFCFSDNLLSKKNDLARDNSFSPEFLMTHCILTLKQDGVKESSQSEFLPLLSDRAGFDIGFFFNDATNVSSISLVFTKITRFTLHSLNVLLVDDEGKTAQLSLSQCEHHGFQINGNHIIFLGEAPTITMRVPDCFDVAEVHIAITAREKVEDIHISQLARGKKSLFIGRCWRYLKRQIRK